MESENFLTKMGITTHFQDAAKIKNNLLLGQYGLSDGLCGQRMGKWLGR